MVCFEIILQPFVIQSVYVVQIGSNIKVGNIMGKKNKETRIINKLYKKMIFIRAKMLYLPCLILLIGVIVIGGMSSYYINGSFLERIGRDGCYNTQRFVACFEDRAPAIKRLNIKFEKMHVVMQGQPKRMKNFSKNRKSQNPDIYKDVRQNIITILVIGFLAFFLMALLLNQAKREKQREIEYLSFHDYVTGLYNRRHMEVAIKKMDIAKNLPLAVMRLDVNGLKLTNDAFGYKMGNQLLINVVTILNRVCRSEDIIAHIGDEEFFIILPQANSDQVMVIQERIIKETAKIKLASVVLSVAVGYDVKTEESQTMEDIIESARNIMNERKRKQGKVMRSQVIENVLRSINFKYDNEQVHTERVAQYCELIAKAMNFSDREIDTIRQAGELHDIGKIMILPELLNKKEKLTEHEFQLIKKHVETGYIILRNTDDYASLAKIVRYHHERFDGNGYPDRLKAEEIPLESRIIAVADAYEAMTGNRVYQKPKSQKEALLEIKKCSGAQFDPQIVEVFLKIMKGESEFHKMYS